MSDLVTTETRPIGFWGSWGLTVGCMIGSGIFMLPTVLAPFGILGLAGWAVTGLGAICIALVLGRLAARSGRAGGPPVFVKDALGDFAGFIAGWSLWVSLVIAVPTIVAAFVGYAGAVLPGMGDSALAQITLAICVIVTLTGISMRGAHTASIAALAMTVLKLVPLVLVVMLAFGWGDLGHFPTVADTGSGPLASIAAASLLTMWAFLGLEAGTVSGDQVRDAKRTIPRAVTAGVLTVTGVYVLVTVATMMLVAPDALATSQAPLVDATRMLGSVGFAIVVAGALVSTAGAAHGVIFVAAQMSCGMAMDGLAPRIFARRNVGGAPVFALLICGGIGCVLVVLNYSDGLIAAFKFLLTMSTATALLPYLMCAVAELKASWSSSPGWIALAFVAAMYSMFALIGSGLTVLLWGGVLVAIGVPIYISGRRDRMRTA